MPSNSAESEALEVAHEEHCGGTLVQRAVYMPHIGGLLACMACGTVCVKGKEERVCPVCGAHMGEIFVM